MLSSTRIGGARVDLVAGRDRRREPTSAGRRGERMTPPSSRLTRCVNAVHLDEVDRAVGARDQAVALAVHGDLAAVGVEALDVGIGRVHLNRHR